MGGAAAIAAPVGAQIIGGFLQGSAQQEEGLRQEIALRQQARLAELAAADALIRGQREAGQSRMQGSQIIGEQQVAAAASGVEASSGTPAALAAQTRAFAALDAETARVNAAREAWGLRTNAKQLRSEASAARARGTSAAIATGIGTAGQIGGSVYGYGRTQGWWGGGA